MYDPYNESLLKYKKLIFCQIIGQNIIVWEPKNYSKFDRWDNFYFLLDHVLMNSSLL